MSSLRITSKVAAEAANYLSDQGFTFPQKPNEEGIPLLPADITEVDDNELMNLFTEFTSWCDYANTQFSLAKIGEREAEKSMSRLEAAGMATRGLAKGERVTAAKAVVAASPDVLKAAEKVDRAYAYRVLAESIYTNLERDIALVSRELTRRTASSTGSRQRSMTA